MEEGQGSTTESLEDLATDGQKYLDNTVEAAHDILASLDEVLCNPLLWTQPASSSAQDSAGKSTASSEQGWQALETCRLRYKSSTADLRATIGSIFDHPRMKPQEGDSSMEIGESADLDQLELRAAQLRQEVQKKNQLLKVVIDQSRELVSDISMWQNAEL